MNSNTGDEGCQSVYESPKFMMFPCLWAVFTENENGELKIVPILGILCSWLASREKEFVFGLYYNFRFMTRSVNFNLLDNIVSTS